MLYIGVAAPLIEAAHVWVAAIPPASDAAERSARRREFPKHLIGAYHFSNPDPDTLVFRTGLHVNTDRVRNEVERWSGARPSRLPQPYRQPIPPLDHRQALAELKRSLHGPPVQVRARIGLTLQQLQKDIDALRPEIVLLNCHGTKEGCLIFENGRGAAEYVPGDRLFPLFHNEPAVLFLSACYSQAVLIRAGKQAE